MWLVAHGYGSWEVLGWSDSPCEPDPGALDVAQWYAPDVRCDPLEILKWTWEDFPNWRECIEAQRG